MFDDPEVARLLKDGTVEAEAFDMSVKGFDEECFQLWRLRSGQ
jgi:hypothetical protein